MWIQWKLFLQNRQKPKILPIFRPISGEKGPEIMTRVAYSLHTSQSCSNVLKNNFHVNPVETFYKLDKKIDFWPNFARFRVNKANLKHLIAATGLVLLLKFDPNHRFFNLCDLEIWWMTSKNYRAHLLYYIKLCASFQIHWWIQTEVTVRKREICIQIDNFLSPATLKFDRWPWKTIGHLS